MEEVYIVKCWMILEFPYRISSASWSLTVMATAQKKCYLHNDVYFVDTCNVFAW